MKSKHMLVFLYTVMPSEYLVTAVDNLWIDLSVWIFDSSKSITKEYLSKQNKYIFTIQILINYKFNIFKLARERN